MSVVGNISTWHSCSPSLRSKALGVFERITGIYKEDNTLTMFTGGWAHAGNYGHVRFTLKHVAEDIAEFELSSGAAIIISPKRARY